MSTLEILSSVGSSVFEGFLSLLDMFAPGGTVLQLMPVGIAMIAIALSAWRLRRILAPLLIGSIVFTLTNLVIFINIMLQPKRSGDSPWLEGAVSIGPPPNLPEVPLTDNLPPGLGLLSDLVGGYNQGRDYLAEAGSAGADVFNQTMAYGHVVGLASSYGWYVVGGIILTATLLAVVALRSVAGLVGRINTLLKTLKDREEEVKRLTEDLESAYERLDKTELKQHDTSNFIAYMEGRAHHGHTVHNCDPYDPSFNYLPDGNKNGYAMRHKELSQKRQAGPVAANSVKR